jgi:hypothetical protein
LGFASRRAAKDSRSPACVAANAKRYSHQAPAELSRSESRRGRSARLGHSQGIACADV